MAFGPLHKKYRISAFLLLLSFAASLQAHGFEKSKRIIGRNGESFRTSARLDGLIAVSEGLELKPVSLFERINPLLYLDFENHLPRSLKDAAGHYSVRNADYNISADSWAGKQSALFSRSGNRILIHSPAELWPGQGILHESFTLEMQIKPIYFYSKNQIFSRVSLIDGIRKGMEISIQDGRLTADFHNMLESSDGRFRSASLKSVTRLKTDHWYHIALRYEAESPVIRLYINGKEEDTWSLQFREEKMLLSFHPADRSPIILGQSYIGIMDEFAVHREPVIPPSDEKEGPPRSRYHPVFLDLQGMYPAQKRGTALSEVIVLRKDGRMTFTGLSYKGDEPPGTKLDFFIRYSQSPFAANAPEYNYPWIRVQGKESGIRHADYIQWKAELRSDSEGRFTPRLQEITIEQKTTERPDRPSGLRVVPDLTGPDSITIEWSESSDPQMETGGYNIYIGFRPGEAETKLRIPYRELEMILTPEEKRLQKEDPKLLKRKLHRKKRFRLTNVRIEQETVTEGKFRRNHPFLRSGAAHYITVSAFTENGGESEKSGEITAEMPVR